MKSYKIFSLQTLSFLTLITLLTLASCNKEPNEPTVSVSGFTPTQGVVGTIVTITGNNFSTTATNNIVTFNGKEATVTSATITSIVVTVPVGATSGKIAVTNSSNIATTTSDFIVLAPPTITSFAPTSGNAGSSVVITGTNFDATLANNVVTFNGVAATVTAATTNTLTVTVPSGATTGKISVALIGVGSNGFTVSSATDFTVSGPVVTGLAPLGGRAGTIVVITGANFDANVANNTVKFGTVTAQVATASTTQLAVIVPVGAVTGKVSVSVNNATGYSNDFLVTADPYANFRVKEIDGDDGSIDKFRYDANNNVIEEVDTDPDGNFDDHYTYSAGLLSTEISGATFTSSKITYVYNNGILTQQIESSAPINNGVIGTYSVDNVSVFTFENGLVSTLTYQDANQNTLFKRVYTYSILLNGELQQTITHTPYSQEANPSDVFTFIYSSDLFPLAALNPSQIKNIPISFQEADDASENFTTTYSLDGSGKLSTYKIDYADASRTDVTYTIIYEAKQ